MREMKEVLERLDRIEGKLNLRYPLSNLLDCKFDFNLTLRPLMPTTATEAIYIEQLETRMRASIHQEISNIEKTINNYLRVRL